MKKNLLFLRLIFFGLVMLFGSGWVMGQTLLLNENFDYTNGTLLTANGWTAHSGSGLTPADVVVPGLSYSGYLGDGVGGAANLDNTGEDVYKPFTTQGNGSTIYYSALVKVDVGTAGYFLHLLKNSTTFASRIYVKPGASGKINFGISNIGTASFATTPTEFNVGQTYLLIVKYDVSTTGAGSLWVVSSGVPVSEALAGTAEHTTTGTGQVDIIGVALRQYIATQRIIVDGLRVGTTWDAVTSNFWSGSSTTDWATAGNWSDGVPQAAHNLVIPSTANQALISSGTSASCVNLKVLSGATLTVNSGGSLTSTGTVAVNSGATLASGTTYTNNGTMTVNGTFQINEGGWATGTDFVYGATGTLVFNNSSGFYGFNGGVFWPTLSGPVNVTVQNTGGLELQTSRTVTGVFQTAKGVKNTFGNDLTVSGSVIINSGGYFDSFSPTYSGSGTLIYNTGGSYGVSNEWITGSSIGYGVPQNVTIQTSGTNVSLNANKSILGTLTISNGSILTSGTHVISGDGAITVNDGGTLKVGSTSSSGAIAGNLTNTGGLTLSSGSTVEFNGSAAQTIASRTFSNLTINNASGVTMGSDVSVTVGNTFTNSAGSSFVVASDATNSGSLIISGTYSGTGTFTYQRYMPDANYHMLGSPFSGQTINSFLTNGANSIVLIGSDYSMKNYNEGTDVWSSLYTTGTGGNIVLGQGYATKRSASGTVDLTGTPNTAAISDIALTRTSFGWNLLSNPFTSAIAANAQGDPTNNLISINSSGVLDPNYTALYIWDGTAYKIINHASGSPTASLVQNYLQVGQGFFVKSKLGGGTFSITPAMQSHQTGIAFKSNPIQLAGIVLNAEKNTSKISTQISYKEGMNRGLDIGYDAGLMKSNPSFALYSRLVEDNGVDFGIQCLPAEYDDLVVPIGLDAKSGDIIKFTAQSFNLPEEYNVYLEDRVLGIYTNLSPVDASYNTQLLSDSKGTGRFFVRTSMESALGIGNLDNGNPFKVFTRSNHNQIVIHGEANANTIARIYSISGKQIISYSLKQGTENLVQFNEEAGVYIVKISNEQGTYTQKFGWLR